MCQLLALHFTPDGVSGPRTLVTINIALLTEGIPPTHLGGFANHRPNSHSRLRYYSLSCKASLARLYAGAAPFESCSLACVAAGAQQVIGRVPSRLTIT